jgi:ABC-type multidrug transport system fused ATPase/permease subunit
MRLPHSLRKIFNIWQRLFRPQVGRLIWLSALGLGSGFFDAVGVALLVPLFAFFVGDSTAAVGGTFAVSFLKEVFAYFNIEFTFRFLLFFVITLFLLKTAVLAIFGLARLKILASFKKEIQSSLFSETIGADYRYLVGRPTGYLKSVLTDDVKLSARLLDQVMGVLFALSSVVSYLVVAFSLSPGVTVVTLVIGSFILICFRPVLKLLRRYSKEMIVVHHRFTGFIIESLNGLKTIKAAHVERQVSERARAAFTAAESLEVKRQILKLFSKLVMEPAAVFYIMAAFAISYFYLDFNILSFIAIVYVIQQIFVNLEKFQSSFHVVSAEIPYAEEVARLIEEVRRHRNEQTGAKPFVFNRELVFNRVSFHYDGRRRGFIENVDLVVKKGEQLGIVGPSGAGKTTIVDLLLRLLQPESGEILVDGVNIAEIKLADWRRQIAYVPQEGLIISGTVRDNITFYDNSVNEADIVKAARLANIYEFIKKLPRGLDTVISDRGSNLSGGERQRIVLARALLRQPSILVLDEATSAVDVHSERLIHDTIHSLKGKVTVIIITHRLSTILDVDQVIVLKEGRVIERGNPVQLTANPDSYLAHVSKTGVVSVSSLSI